ncbi:MAG: hypothetical protein ACUZ8H_01235 [Candidatus Anammoxibacter sp.]
MKEPEHISTDIPDNQAYQTAYNWATNFDCYSSEAKDRKKDTLDLLNRVIDKKVCRDIEELHNIDRCILLVSTNEDLIEGVASYIFWHHLDYHGFFYPKNFIGWSKDDIEERLFNYDIELANAVEQYHKDGRYRDRLMKKISSSERNLLQYFNLGGTLLLKNIEDINTEKYKNELGVKHKEGNPLALFLVNGNYTPREQVYNYYHFERLVKPDKKKELKD